MSGSRRRVGPGGRHDVRGNRDDEHPRDQAAYDPGPRGRGAPDTARCVRTARREAAGATGSACGGLREEVAPSLCLRERVIFHALRQRGHRAGERPRPFPSGSSGIAALKTRCIASGCARQLPVVSRVGLGRRGCLEPSRERPGALGLCADSAQTCRAGPLGPTAAEPCADIFVDRAAIGRHNHREPSLP
jgi:hypothetical protein